MALERHYRDHKYFLIRSNLRNDLKEKLSADITNYESFVTNFIEVLSNHAQLREKFFRAYHVSYIRKATKRRSQLETKYLKTKI